MIAITGDIHGHIDIHKLTKANWPKGQTLTKRDTLIILGDFGLIWHDKEKAKKDEWWLKWLNQQPWTTLFIDGNHENHTLLNSYTVTEWNGGKVHFIKDSIIHLMRGQVFTLEGKKIFTYGGAASHDRMTRKENISWWKDELPTVDTENEAIVNLERVGNKVDLILTHDACQKVCEVYGYRNDIDISYVYGQQYRDVKNFFKYIEREVEFKQWFMGHLHHECIITNIEKKQKRQYVLLYDTIMELQDNLEFEGVPHRKISNLS